jgi:hypothetical protein
LIDKYSIIGIYRKWKNGTPISEIVENTGVKRKTWNKRFERLEKKHKTATSGDSSATKIWATSRNGDKNISLIIISIIGFILGVVIVTIFLYEEHDHAKRKTA